MSIIRKQTTTNSGSDAGGKEPLYTVGGNVNSCSHFGNQYGGFSKPLELELPCDPVIFLGIGLASVTY
jgi:hypothetical protein